MEMQASKKQTMKKWKLFLNIWYDNLKKQYGVHCTWLLSKIISQLHFFIWSTATFYEIIIQLYYADPWFDLCPVLFGEKSW